MDRKTNETIKKIDSDYKPKWRPPCFNMDFLWFFGFGIHYESYGDVFGIYIYIPFMVFEFDIPKSKKGER